MYTYILNNNRHNKTNTCLPTYPLANSGSLLHSLYQLHPSPFMAPTKGTTVLKFGLITSLYFFFKVGLISICIHKCNLDAGLFTCKLVYMIYVYMLFIFACFGNFEQM